MSSCNMVYRLNSILILRSSNSRLQLLNQFKPPHIVKQFINQPNQTKISIRFKSNDIRVIKTRKQLINYGRRFLLYTGSTLIVSGSLIIFYSNFILQTEKQRNELYFNLYRKLPLKSISRLWGNINSMDLPVWCRRPCYLLYAWLFNCNLNEIEIEDLTQYKNLSEFFRRKLKPGSRFIDPASNIVSPCDGRILNFGIVENGCLEQVKGVNYSLNAFLGEINWKSKSNANLNYENLVKENPNNNLYHCIIYLAPGDYHRFHSPSEWNIFYRRHFPGELFSVNPAIARWLEGLFSFNERAVYYGKWKYGFFSMSAVGATNVGSIRVYEDPALETNTKQNETDTNKLEKDFRLKNELGIRMSRGAYFGEFNLGSTIVLIFEAPKNFEFQIIPNQKVFLGEPLGSTI